MAASGLEAVEMRPGERAVVFPGAHDASLIFIGVAHTPWTAVGDCPRQAIADGPVCEIEVFEPWLEALTSIGKCERLEVFYWLHLARRDLVVQCPKRSPEPRGTFSIRSPNRPNPIGASIVDLLGVSENRLRVRSLDCLDGTPIIDIKPDIGRVATLPPLA